MAKRIALQLFGHLRTFELTCLSLFTNVVVPNVKDGYIIDFFIHTWDKMDTGNFTWGHVRTEELIDLNVAEDTLKNVYKIYNPKKLLVESQGADTQKGAMDWQIYTMLSVQKLRQEYEKENNINYDWVIWTRPDILFLSEFRIDSYIKTYEDAHQCLGINNWELREIDTPYDAMFCGNNIFGRPHLNLIDPRGIPERDIIWFAKPDVPPPRTGNPLIIPLVYRLGSDFVVLRSENVTYPAIQELKVGYCHAHSPMTNPSLIETRYKEKEMYFKPDTNINTTEVEFSKYKNMQKKYYDNNNITSTDIVGNYTWHEEYPYETFLLHKRGDVRYPLFNNPNKKIALDFACGPGRMVKRMNKIFKRTDGCDLSQRLLDEAKIANPESDFYATNGDDLGDTPKNYYDFVYCTISMQHICVHSIRMNILKHLSEVLNDSGCFTLQLAYVKNPSYEAQITHAKWNEDKVNAQDTNSGCDVMITEADLPIVIKDFENYFSGVELWFSDIKEFNNTTNLTCKHPDYWPTHWIYIHGRKK